jgi:hypothetical protein
MGAGEPANLEVIDSVRVPAHLKPGRYVLSWRWDCEEGAQVTPPSPQLLIARLLPIIPVLARAAFSLSPEIF